MFEALVEDFKIEFRKNLVTVIKFGAEAEPDNVLFVFHEINPAVLLSIRKILKKHRSNMPVVPLFFTKKEILEGADVFPLDYLDIKYPHQLLYGTDVINQIKFDKKAIRHQLEFEVRSKLIHLREHYIWMKSHDELRALLWSSLPSILPLLYGLLYLKNIEPPDEFEFLYSSIKDEFNLNVTILKKMKQLKNVSDAELHVFVKEIMNFLTELSEIVDKIRV